MRFKRTTRHYLPLFIYVVLLAVGIPWYWPSHDLSLILGMPAWVSVAITASLIASCYTVYLLYTSWPESHDDE